MHEDPVTNSSRAPGADRSSIRRTQLRSNRFPDYNPEFLGLRIELSNHCVEPIGITVLSYLVAQHLG